MKGRFALLLIAALASATGAHAACEVFEHEGFSGQSLTIADNASRAELGALSDKVSSIKVSRQCLMVAFADPGFRGATTTFSPGEHPSLAEGWNDQISSARCNCR